VGGGDFPLLPLALGLGATIEGRTEGLTDGHKPGSAMRASFPNGMRYPSTQFYPYTYYTYIV
jgi:hypothetical protein